MRSDSRLEFFYRGLREKNTYVGSHNHNCYELVYYLRGGGMTVIGDKKYAYSDNSFALIKPFCPHDEYHSSETEVIFIGFSYDDTAIKLRSGLYSFLDREPVLSLLNEILREAGAQKPHFRLMLESKINELAVRLSRKDGEGSKRRRDLLYIINYIEENSGQKINFRELAGLCGYSCDHFRRIFRKETGFSPQEYLINRRFEKALEMMKNPGVSVTETAYASGFSSGEQFSAMFKKRFGQPPKKYRTSLGL